ncbi:hypothetical protein Tco_0347249 [Tanacetum coccineum]
MLLKMKAWVDAMQEELLQFGDSKGQWIGSLMFVTDSRPYIMFAGSVLVIDSDYAGANLDRKSTTGWVVQFLGWKTHYMAMQQKSNRCGQLLLQKTENMLLACCKLFMGKFYGNSKSIMSSVDERGGSKKFSCEHFEDHEIIRPSIKSLFSGVVFVYQETCLCCLTQTGDGNNERDVVPDSFTKQAIFDAIQLMGYEGDLTVLTFNKALFFTPMKKGKTFLRQSYTFVYTMLGQPTQDEGASSEKRLSDEINLQPSPAPIVMLRSNKLKKQDKHVIKTSTIEYYEGALIAKQRFPRTSFSKKHRVHKESISKQGRKIAKVSTDESKVSTDEQKEGTEEKVESTARQIKGTKDQTKEEIASQTSTQTPTSMILVRFMKTIAYILINMSSSQKFASKEKRKGSDPKIDKGKKKKFEEGRDESEREDDVILTSCIEFEEDRNSLLRSLQEQERRESSQIRRKSKVPSMIQLTLPEKIPCFDKDQEAIRETVLPSKIN